MLKNMLLILILFTASNFVKSFSSCDDILQGNPQAKSGTYNINIDGKQVEVECNMDDQCGGWTLVYSVKGKQCTGTACSIYEQIDDKGLQYREVYFKSRPGHYIAYAGGDTNWYSSGFSLLHNTLRFNSQWYFYRTVTTWRGCGASAGADKELDFNGLWQLSSYIFNYEWRITKWSDRCFSGGVSFLNKYCADEFVVQAPGRLDGYGDLESLAQSCNGDNRINLDFDIYVR